MHSLRAVSESMPAVSLLGALSATSSIASFRALSPGSSSEVDFRPGYRHRSTFCNTLRPRLPTQFARLRLGITALYLLDIHGFIGVVAALLLNISSELVGNRTKSCAVIRTSASRPQRLPTTSH